RDGDFINAANGIADLTGEAPRLLPHTPDYFPSYCLSYPFDPEAECPTWIKCVATLSRGDVECAMVLQDAFGYSLTRVQWRQVFCLLYGPGNNGKSTVLTVLRAMLGEQNCSNLTLDQFSERFLLQKTLGKLANVAPDVGELDKRREHILKAYSAGDPQTFDIK